MTYVRRKVFHVLEFSGELAGLHVRVRHTSGNTFKDLGQLDPQPTVAEPLPALPLFLENVDRWDLEYEDGGLVPMTFEAFMGHDVAFIKAVLAAYVETLSLPYPVAAAPAAAPAPTHDAEMHDTEIPDVVGPDLEHLERFVHNVEPETVEPETVAA